MVNLSKFVFSSRFKTFSPSVVQLHLVTLTICNASDHLDTDILLHHRISGQMDGGSFLAMILWYSGPPSKFILIVTRTWSLFAEYGQIGGWRFSRRHWSVVWLAGNSAPHHQIKRCFSGNKTSKEKRKCVGFCFWFRHLLRLKLRWRANPPITHGTIDKPWNALGKAEISENYRLEIIAAFLF